MWGCRRLPRDRATMSYFWDCRGGKSCVIAVSSSIVECSWNMASGVDGHFKFRHALIGMPNITLGPCRKILSGVAEHHRRLGLGEHRAEVAAPSSSGSPGGMSVSPGVTPAIRQDSFCCRTIRLLCTWGNINVVRTRRASYLLVI